MDQPQEAVMESWTPTPVPLITEGSFEPRAFPAVDRLDRAISLLARKPVILTLALSRTGSKALHQFFFKVFEPPHKTAHSHGVSRRFEAHTLAKGNPDKVKLFQRTASLLNSGGHTTIAVPIRQSVPRIYSHYLYANRTRIEAVFSPNGFSHEDEIRRDFEAFAKGQAIWESFWYREELLEPFGFDFLSLPRDMGDSHTASVKGRTIVILRSETMSQTVKQAGQQIKGWEMPREIEAANTGSGYGLANVSAAFKAQFPFPPSALEILRSNPYSGHLYPVP